MNISNAFPNTKSKKLIQEKLEQTTKKHFLSVGGKVEVGI